MMVVLAGAPAYCVDRAIHHLPYTDLRFYFAPLKQKVRHCSQEPDQQKRQILYNQLSNTTRCLDWRYLQDLYRGIYLSDDGRRKREDLWNVFLHNKHVKDFRHKIQDCERQLTILVKGTEEYQDIEKNKADLDAKMKKGQPNEQYILDLLSKITNDPHRQKLVIGAMVLAAEDSRLIDSTPRLYDPESGRVLTHIWLFVALDRLGFPPIPFHFTVDNNGDLPDKESFRKLRHYCDFFAQTTVHVNADQILTETSFWVVDLLLCGSAKRRVVHMNGVHRTLEILRNQNKDQQKLSPMRSFLGNEYRGLSEACVLFLMGRRAEGLVAAQKLYDGAPPMQLCITFDQRDLDNLKETANLLIQHVITPGLLTLAHVPWVMKIPKYPNIFPQIQQTLQDNGARHPHMDRAILAAQESRVNKYKKDKPGYSRFMAFLKKLRNRRMKELIFKRYIQDQ